MQFFSVHDRHPTVPLYVDTQPMRSGTARGYPLRKDLARAEAQRDVWSGVVDLIGKRADALCQRFQRPDRLRARVDGRGHQTHLARTLRVALEVMDELRIG